MNLPAVVTVFDVADDSHEFLEYLAYLYEQGLRPTRDAWLKETADRLMRLANPAVGPPTHMDQAWTLERRRLLVVLTWPYAYGELAPRFPIADDPHGMASGISGVYGREYPELWAQVRTNLKSLEWLAEERGSWAVLAEKWSLEEDLLWESARLGLIVTPLEQGVGADVVDALRSDAHDRAARAREGFVLTWWEIVAVAEGAGFSFEPIGTSDAKKYPRNRSGRYLWNRKDLVERIGKASLNERFKRDMHARDEAVREAMTSQELAPLELHRRITADGRISPPPVGSKYRALFEYLDGIDFVGKRRIVRLSRETLDELTSRGEFDAKRTIRGARGKSGLPNSALRNATWWYGPWNPDDADRDTDWAAIADPSRSEAMGKKSQTRAWMATGLRAKPIINRGTRTLVAVQFEPVAGREHWWPWRGDLRKGSFSEPVWGD